MQGKKKYIALILFLFLGLMVFTFANPAETEEKEDKKANTGEVVKEDGSKKTTTNNDGLTGEQNVVVFNTVNARRNVQTALTGNAAVAATNQTEDDSYAKALEMVKKAEESLAKGDYSNAQNLVNNLTDGSSKDELNDRLDKVLNCINVSELVANLEKMVKEATSLTDMTDARGYNTKNDISNAVNKLENEKLKEELTNRLNDLNGLLSDEDSPVVTGINDGDVVNTLANVKVEDANTYTVTLNGEEYELGTELAKDGEYELVIVDAAFNETRIKFTYDTTDPKLNFTNGSIKEIHKIEVQDNNFDYMTIKNFKTGEVITVYEKEYELSCENADNLRFDVTAYDKAGNKTKTTNIYIDNVSPKAEGAAAFGEEEVALENNGIYRNVNLKVSDSSLKNVVITKDSKEIVNENFKDNYNSVVVLKYENLFDEEGLYTVKATDRMGHESVLTFTIDRTPAKRVYSTLDFENSGKVPTEIDKVKYYYMKNGDSAIFRMQFSEKLAKNPTVTIGNIKFEISLKEKIAEKEGIYVYEGMFTIPENESELVEGVLDIKLSNVIDLAGNESVDELVLNQTKTSNSRSIMYDRTAPAYDSLRIVGGTYNKIDNVYYAKAGTKVYVYVTFKEKLEKAPTLKINDKEYEMNVINKDKENYQYYSNKVLADDLEDGVVNFEVYGYADKAGNVGTNLTNEDITLDSQSKVIVDKVAPEYKYLRVLRIKPNSSKYAKNGDTIRVLAYFEEELSTNAKLKVNGKEVSFGSKGLYREDMKVYQYTADYTIPEDENKLEEGILKFEVYGYADKAKNVGKTLSEKDTNWNTDKKVIYDRTAPVIKTAGKQETYDMVMRIEAGTPISLDDILATVTDNIDDEIKIEPYLVDLLIGSKEENIYKYDFTNGLNTRYVGRYNIYYKATDNAGNTNEETLLLVMSDTTAPVITLNGKDVLTLEYGASTYKEEYATVTDNVDDTKYNVKPDYINKYTLWSPSEGITYKGRVDSVNTNEIGTYILYYTAKDAHGNVAKTVSRTVHVKDTTIPTATITYSELEYGNVVATLKASEAIYTPSGWKMINAQVYQKTYTKNTEETIEIKDLRGNKGTAVVSIQNIPVNLPTADVKYSTTKLTNGDVKVTITASENITMPNSKGWYADGRAHIYSKIFKANATEEVIIASHNDGGARQRKITITVNNIDKKAPTAELFYKLEDDGKVVVTITANEAITVDGGKHKSGGKVYTKTFDSVDKLPETVEFKDLAGNIGSAKIDKELVK